MELVVCRLNSIHFSRKSKQNETQKRDRKTRRKLPSITENRNLSKGRYFPAASVELHGCERQVKQVLLFALHSKTSSLNKQSLECEWTGQYTGPDSHPQHIPADACGILPGINLTLASWKIKQHLSFLGSSFHCGWEHFSWRLPEFKHGAGSFTKQMSPRQVVKWHRGGGWLVKAEAISKGQIFL